MPTTTVIDNPFVTLCYDPDTKIVHHEIHKFVFGKNFQEFLLAGTETLRTNKAKKWLSDDRNNPVMSKEDIDWAQTNWFPQTAQAGWKFWAIVQPEQVLAQMGMERLVKIYAEAGITAKFFSDPKEAMTWLKSQ